MPGVRLGIENGAEKVKKSRMSCRALRPLCVGMGCGLRVVGVPVRRATQGRGDHRRRPRQPPSGQGSLLSPSEPSACTVPGNPRDRSLVRRGVPERPRGGVSWDCRPRHRRGIVGHCTRISSATDGVAWLRDPRKESRVLRVWEGEVRIMISGPSSPCYSQDLSGWITESWWVTLVEAKAVVGDGRREIAGDNGELVESLAPTMRTPAQASSNTFSPTLKSTVRVTGLHGAPLGNAPCSDLATLPQPVVEDISLRMLRVSKAFFSVRKGGKGGQVSDLPSLLCPVGLPRRIHVCSTVHPARTRALPPCHTLTGEWITSPTGRTLGIIDHGTYGRREHVAVPAVAEAPAVPPSRRIERTP